MESRHVTEAVDCLHVSASGYKTIASRESYNDAMNVDTCSLLKKAIVNFGVTNEGN
jgi:hypothetical protein